MAEARQRIEALDRERVRFYKDTYHVNWYDCRLYDCVVDTHLLSIKGAAEEVVRMAERISRAPSEAAAPAGASRDTAPTLGLPRREPVEGAPPPDGQIIAIRDGQVRVRPMTSGDAPRLGAMLQSLPARDILFLRRNVTDPLVVEQLERDVLDGKVLTLLAETLPGPGEQPEVVGEATLRHSEVPWTSHTGEVRAIVSPAYRGRGLGITLLREILRAAADAGIDKVTAETIAEQTTTQAVLAKLGFVEEGRFSGYTRDLTGNPHDLVVMTYTRPPLPDEE
jgi:RimJ/RimL family protein N-acetyltransferase